MIDESKNGLLVATLDGDELVVRSKVGDESQDELLDQLHQGKHLFARVEFAVAESERDAIEVLENGDGERERFQQFLDKRREEAVEHSEIDQRAAATAIIMEHAAEVARNEHGGAVTVNDVVKAVLRYLDYQRAELNVERPPGESGDMNWHVRLALSNAGVSPEKALTSTLMMLADYQRDIYGQNAKIRRRFGELEVIADMVPILDKTVQQNRIEMLDMMKQMERAVHEVNPGWSGLELDAELRMEMEHGPWKPDSSTSESGNES